MQGAYVVLAVSLGATLLIAYRFEEADAWRHGGGSDQAVWLALAVGVPTSLFLFGLVRQLARTGQAALRANAELRESEQALLETNRELEQRVGELERTRGALAFSRSAQEATLECTRDAILMVNQEGRIVMTNRAFTQMWNVPPEMLEGTDFTRAQHWILGQLLDPAAFARGVGDPDREPGPEESDLLVTRDGRLFERSLRAQRIQDTRVGRIWRFHDVTAERAAEVALNTSRELYRSLVENLPLAFYREDLTGRIVYANRAWHQLLGSSEAAGLEGSAIWGVAMAAELDAMRQEVLGSQETRERVIAWDRAGREGAMLQVLMMPAIERDGSLGGAQALAWDVTRREQVVQERLSRSRLESLGTLAGSLAHDFNNVLMVILGNLTLARMTAPLPEEVQSILEKAEQAAGRAQELTQQLLTFAKGGAPIRRTTALKPILLDALRLAFGSRAGRVRVDVADDLPQIEADPGQLVQAFVNVLLRGRDGTSDPSELTVRCGLQTRSAPKPSSLRAGPYLEVSVHERGVAIAADELRGFFDPFINTDDPKRFGLAVALSIVERHGGQLSVTSVEDTGTTFRFLLPVTTTVAGEPGRSGLAPRARKAETTRILVMDDDAGIRQVAEGLLQHLGYQIQTTSDGQQALAAWEAADQAARRFDLVILDLTVPGGMGGVDTLGELRKRDPALKAIVSSGYSDDPVMSEFRRYGFDGVVAKPYRLVELERVLATVLGLG